MADKGMSRPMRPPTMRPSAIARAAAAKGMNTMRGSKFSGECIMLVSRRDGAHLEKGPRTRWPEASRSCCSFDCGELHSFHLFGTAVGAARSRA